MADLVLRHTERLPPDHAWACAVQAPPQRAEGQSRSAHAPAQPVDAVPPTRFATGGNGEELWRTVTI